MLLLCRVVLADLTSRGLLHLTDPDGAVMRPGSLPCSLVSQVEQDRAGRGGATQARAALQAWLGEQQTGLEMEQDLAVVQQVQTSSNMG